MNYLLDTMIVSALLRRELQPVERVRSLSPLTDDVFVSVVTYGETWEGLREMARGRRRIEYEERARDLFDEIAVVPVNKEVADSYARIKADLRRRGLPIPEADYWIAATAHFYGFVLVTDDFHFSRIPEIPVENWLVP